MPVSAQLLKKVATSVSQQDAMARSLTMLDHGSRLFEVETGWQARAILDDAGAVQCETLAELEAAVRDADVKVIFMSFRALILPSDIENIIKRNGATKTLFKEVLA